MDWTNGVCAEEDEGCEDGFSAAAPAQVDHSEYQRTIEDLLGITTDHRRSRPTANDGFPNDVDASWCRVCSRTSTARLRRSGERGGRLGDVTASPRRVR